MSNLFFDGGKIVFYLFPFIITFIIYRFIYRKKQNVKKAMKKTITYSTLIYIISVLYLIRMLFGSYFIGYILIILISLLGLILVIQWKNGEEVLLWSGIKVLWRFCFLLFFMSYLSLLIYYFIQSIFLLFIL